MGVLVAFLVLVLPLLLLDAAALLWGVDSRPKRGRISLTVPDDGTI